MVRVTWIYLVGSAGLMCLLAIIQGEASMDFDGSVWHIYKTVIIVWLCVVEAVVGFCL